MSKNMQLKVTVQPYYEKNGLEKTFPRLARHLESQDADLVNRNPSLYELAGQVDLLLYNYDGTPLKDVLIRHKDQLKNSYKDIQNYIAEWNLAAADKLLYNIEDTFEAIESELD